jgi:ABC-type transport system involved in Fe-S cluster assembly fused permease/ATPase subunit
MAYSVWGWSSRASFTTGDVVFVNTLLAQLFRPLDLLGMVYREIRQGLIDMEAMFGLADTNCRGRPTSPMRPRTRCRTAARVRFEHVHFAYEPERQILHDASTCRSCPQAAPWRWSAIQVRASRPSPGCCSASTTSPPAG